MRALRGILFLNHCTINNKNYNFMGCPNTPQYSIIGDMITYTGRQRLTAQRWWMQPYTP
jgi:hypothetical protein